MSTRKDFIATAKIIATVGKGNPNPEEGLAARILFAGVMANKFAGENPLFNRKIFYKACDVPYCESNAELAS